MGVPMPPASPAVPCVRQGNFGWEVLDYAFGTMDEWVRIGGREGCLAQAKAESRRGKGD